MENNSLIEKYIASQIASGLDRASANERAEIIEANPLLMGLLAFIEVAERDLRERDGGYRTVFTDTGQGQ